MHTPTRKPAIAAAAVTCLLAVAAAGCGGDSGGGSGGSGGSGGGKDAAEDKPAAKKVPASEAVLTKAQLQDALVSKADGPKGYSYDPVPKDMIKKRPLPKTQPAACAAIEQAAQFGTSKKPRPTAFAVIQVGNKKERNSVQLESHPGKGARQTLADLKKALGQCAVYTTGGGSVKLKMKPLTAPSAGDEAVSFNVKGSFNGFPVDVSETVMRIGHTVVVYGHTKGRPTPAPGLLEAQTKKLEKAMASTTE